MPRTGSDMGYQKYACWLGDQAFKDWEISRQGKAEAPVIESHIPCRVLRNPLKIGIVPPSAWSEGFCRRRTSWYRGCGKAGKYLVVSSLPLDSFPVQPEILLTDSVFKPESLPLFDEIRGLALSVPFLRKKPIQWDQIDDREREVYRRWFERFGGEGPFDFERLILFHSANHANFIAPDFFMKAGRDRVPYSIADSLHTCSSCLEFFNILGEEWPVKYVVPCLGAVQFARLPRNRYLKVTSKKD